MPQTGAMGKAADIVRNMLERERVRRYIYMSNEMPESSTAVSVDGITIRIRSQTNVAIAGGKE